MSDGTTLLFGLPGVRVERVERRAEGIRVVHVVTADEAAAACPGCGVVSTSVKEQVRTSPKDIPYGHDDIEVHWHKTRWRCREDYREKSSFTEAIAQVPARARTTTRLRTAMGAAKRRKRVSRRISSDQLRSIKYPAHIRICKVLEVVGRRETDKAVHVPRAFRQ